MVGNIVVVGALTCHALFRFVIDLKAVQMNVQQSADGVRRHPNSECLGYDIKQSDSELPVMLELWGMQSTPLPSLPGPLLVWVVIPDRVLSMGQIELFDYLTECKQMTDVWLIT